MEKKNIPEKYLRGEWQRIIHIPVSAIASIITIQVEIKPQVNSTIFFFGFFWFDCFLPQNGQNSASDSISFPHFSHIISLYLTKKSCDNYANYGNNI